MQTGTNALSGPAINRFWENEKARELIEALGDDQSSRTRKPDIRQRLSPKAGLIDSWCKRRGLRRCR